MDELLTRAERTDYRETSLHAEVVAFAKGLAAQSDRVKVETFGKTPEGRELVALLVSNDGCFSFEEAERQEKAIVMIEANIHAGEVEGKEACLHLCRDLALSRRGKQVLDRLLLVVVPDINPDGNDRISPNNRKLHLAALEGQVNPPGGVGTRYTGEGWNMNRDAMKQEAPETRALVSLFQRFRPHVFIDCHTTDGSLHGYDLTFDTSHANDEVFSELRAFTRRFLERSSARIEEESGFPSQWYGNFVVEHEPESGWQTYPALPRFGSHYRGLLGRIDVLLETYSYIDFGKRVRVIEAWLRELVRRAAKKADAIRGVVRRTEAMIEELHADPRKKLGIDFGVRHQDETGLRIEYPAIAAGETVKIRSFDRASLKERTYPGREKMSYKVPHKRTFVPVTSVAVPPGYVVPGWLAPRLQAHGVRFEPAPQAELLVDSYRVLRKQLTHSPDVAGVVPPPGQAEAPLSTPPPPRRFETVLDVAIERRRLTPEKGALLVPTSQPAAALVTYLLEPHSDDGLCRWQFLDHWITAGALYPIHRLAEAKEGRVRPE